MLRKIVAALALLAGICSAAFAQQRVNWTPQSFDEFRAVVSYYSNHNKYPVILSTLSPSTFDEYIDRNSVTLLDPNSRQIEKRKESEFFFFAMTTVEKEITTVDVHYLYFRDQQLSQGKPYRLSVVTFELECKTRKIGIKSGKYYDRAENGTQVDTLPGGKVIRKVPPPRSVSDHVIAAVCDDKFHYRPQ